MQQLRNAQTINMSAELFEKLFLSRHDSISGTVDWRKSLGNPTPIALVGIVISLTPLSCDLMGLLGAGGNGAAGVATYYFFGGLLLLLAALLEWLMGNTFPSVVFAAYGAFFFSFGGTLTPSFAAFASYAPAGADPASGLRTQAFNASFGWILVWMCVLSLMFFICSLRTNIALVTIFFSLVGVFGTLAGAYFFLAANFDRNGSTAGTFVKAGGVCGFVASMATWWFLLSTLLDTVDFPIRLPLGDLSGWIEPGSARRGSMA
ncbi:gpr1-like plasma membrane protein [Cercophora newfieldiana]|uniref:Gpr1-like plasma membrane protein n=1 Tax=Cercophora newfieldiana TaxID=92897 RepID=A0AA39Y958_9PEZI|nr:gpr1-like plasma membrane protein [Cercophora newfieldiana]